MIEASASPERRLHDILDGKLDGYFHTDVSIHHREPPLELITRPGA